MARTESSFGHPPRTRAGVSKRSVPRWLSAAAGNEPAPPPVSRSRADRGSSPVSTRDQRHASAQVSRAHVLCEAGAFSEAERVARAALVRWPGLATARVALGRALIGLDRLAEAQGVLFETIHAHPGYASAQRWLAEALLRSGDEGRGRAFLADALRVSSDRERLDELIVRETGEVVLPGWTPAALEPTRPPSVRRRRRSNRWTAVALVSAVMALALVLGGLLAAAVSDRLDERAASSAAG
jgi:tetratricopeptide (TPR) repeat protein